MYPSSSSDYDYNNDQTTSPPVDSSVCNFTNYTFDPATEPYSPTTKILFLIIYIIILIITIIGSSLLLYAVAVTKKTTTTIFIASKTIAGILLAIWGLVYYYVAIETVSNWSGGYLLCKIGDWFQSALIMVISLTLLAMSCYKCKSVTSPMRETPAKKFAILACLILWGLAFFLAHPYFIFNGLYFEQYVWRCFCYLMTPHYLVQFGLQIFIPAFEYFLPVVVMTLIYSAVCCRKVDNYGGRRNGYWTSGYGSALVGGGGGGNDDEQELSEKSHTKMLITAAVLFGVLFLPGNLFSILSYFIRIPNNVFYPMRTVGHILATSYACFFPVVYLKMGSNLNRAVREAPCWICKG